MIKKLLFLLNFILVCGIITAKQVDVNSAQNVANKFLTGQTKVRNASIPTLTLVHTAKNQTQLRSASGEMSYYYIFNIGNNNGFVIISADDINVPVIGYSKEGSYDSENLPDNFKTWMQSVELGMADAISKGVTPSESVRAKWDNYLSNVFSPSPGGGEGGGEDGPVDFLIKTKWNQYYPYNKLIPYLVEGTTSPVTGCVATAVAQLMKYYNYPIRGKKTTDAYMAGQGTSNPTEIPAINLTQYTYDWENMLNEYYQWENTYNTEPEKNAVALLMYHVGASARMNYGYSSGAATSRAARALVDCFGYDGDMFNISKSYYTAQDWYSLIKNEIKNRRPVYMEGWGNGGHAFICDGYDENGLFHFNWGWGGYLDGYFNLDAPLEYVNSQQIIANIKPENGIEEAQERIVTSLRIDKNIYKKNENAQVYYNVYEPSLNSRRGDYYVALYSMTDNFVSIITQLTPEGTKYNKINKELQPGQYKLKVVEKLSSGSYNLLKQSPNVENITVTIINEVKSHNLLLLSMYTEKAGYPGKEFEVQLSINSSTQTNSYIGIALIDQNNNKYFINQPVIESIPSYLYKNYSCKIPDNIPNGIYKIRPLAKEENMPWDTIPPYYSSGTSYSDYEIFENTSGYRISRASPYENIIKRNGSSFVTLNLTSKVYDDTRLKNLKGALYDNNDNLISVLESAIETYGYGDYYMYCKVSESVQAGNYKLKIVEETSTNSYIPAPTTESFIAESITVTNDIISHELTILNNSEFYSSATTFTSRAYISTSISFGNRSNKYPFIGCYGMALTDEYDNIKHLLFQRCGNKLDAGWYYKSYSFSGYLPNDLIPGNYRLRMVAKMDGIDNWGIVKDESNNNYIDYLNITVIATRSTTELDAVTKNTEISLYPNPVKDMLHINSPEAQIKRVTLIDLMGKMIFAEDMNDTEKTISIQHLPQNTYILKVETSEGESIHKISKE